MTNITRHLRTLVLALGLLSPGAALATSTVNPVVPAQSAPLNSSVVRNNFLATYNDINNVLGKFAGTTSPSNQTALQDWVDTSAAPVYKFKFWNPTTGTWVQWGSLNISSGVFSVTATSGSLAATAPIAVNFSGGVATYSINLDGNFAVTGGSLALASVGSGHLIANCTSGSAEPGNCAWTTYADQAIGASNGILPYRTGGAWSTASTGITGHVLPFLDSATLNFSGVLTSYAGAGTPAVAQSGTLLRAVALDGSISRAQLDSFGQPGRFSCVRADTGLAAPTTLQTDDEICSFNGFGYDGAAYGGPAVGIRTYAGGVWSNTSHPTYIDFATTNTGSTTLTSQGRVNINGGLTWPTGVTGGSKGSGTINASGVYVGGNAVASSATSPVILNASTGAVSVQGNSGTVLLGQSGTGSVFTAHPQLGTAGSTVGAIDFANASSGLVTVSPPTGALGTVTNTLQAVSDTFVYLATADTLTNKTLTTPTINGAALSGTLSGSPTLSGVPVLSGLSAGTCSTGLGLDASNHTIKTSCPGAASSVQVGTTSVASAVQNTLLGPGTVTAGTGTLSTVTPGYGLSVTTSAIGVAISTATQALSSNITLNNTSTFFDGPSMSQGGTGTWFAIGKVDLQDNSAGATFACKLWDGTTVIQDGITNSTATTKSVTMTLSGFLTSPAGNIKMSCEDSTSTSGFILGTTTGTNKESVVNGWRTQ